jgi:hypothetical protein
MFNLYTCFTCKRGRFGIFLESLTTYTSWLYQLFLWCLYFCKCVRRLGYDVGMWMCLCCIVSLVHIFRVQSVPMEPSYRLTKWRFKTIFPTVDQCGWVYVCMHIIEKGSFPSILKGSNNDYYTKNYCLDWLCLSLSIQKIQKSSD